jgi:hypothetical protein
LDGERCVWKLDGEEVGCGYKVEYEELQNSSIEGYEFSVVLPLQRALMTEQYYTTIRAKVPTLTLRLIAYVPGTTSNQDRPSRRMKRSSQQFTHAKWNVQHTTHISEYILKPKRLHSERDTYQQAHSWIETESSETSRIFLHLTWLGST